MLYAIVSDIHANRQAWEAVLSDIRAHQADEILCLGDIVGYGPAPAAVLRSVYAHCKHIITGNHDAALCGRTAADSFNPRAQAALAWTRTRLARKSDQVLKDLPLSMKGDHFRCVHGSPRSPSQYNYIIETGDADKTWSHFSERVCFVGHSHVPGVFFTEDNLTSHRAPSGGDVTLEPDKRYIVNVGSVGQPRDGTVLASYCLFDTDRRMVYFRQVSFDIDAYKRELDQTSLPAGAGGFLDAARGLNLPPVRDLIDFSPFERETETATEVDIAVLARDLRRWKLVSLIALVVILCLSAGVALTLAHAKADTPGVTYARKTSVACLTEPKIGEELLEPPESIGELSKTNRLQWYDARVTDPPRQTVAAISESPDGAPVFRLTSSSASPFAISGIPAVAPRHSRFRAKCQFKCHAPNAGFIEVLIAQQSGAKGIKILGRSEPDITNRKERWYQCSTTLADPLHGGERIFFLIRGEFTGAVSLRNLQFVRVE
ncbi:MAG: metallophosphoesterase family protein [Lentisphaeria bacterium]|nr:metallophosphoesterase family protein [Lentisphaeria bacterium]